MSIDQEMRDRMLVLEEDNQQDSEEYKQLSDLLNPNLESKPVATPVATYPTTEHLVIIHCDDFERVGCALREHCYEIVDAHNGMHRYIVKGIPADAARLPGVSIIGWRESCG